MNNKKQKICGLIVLAILFTPQVLAATVNDNDSLLSPGMGMAWYRAQSADFKNLLTWLFGGTIFIVGSAYILFTAFGVTSTHYENTFGSQEAKSRHGNTLLKNFGVLIGMIAVVMVGLSIFNWF